MLCALIQDDIVVECPIELNESEIQNYAGRYQSVFAIENLDPIPKVGWHKVGKDSSGIFCHEMRALINPWVEPKISGDLSISTPHKVWDMVK